MANFGQMLDINSRSMPSKGKAKKPEIHSLEHSRSANGGHVFLHRFESSGQYHEPETHTFGADEGKQALAHFAEHAGLSEHMGNAEEEDDA